MRHRLRSLIHSLLESLSAAPLGSGFLAGKQVAFWFRRLGATSP